MDFNNPPPRVMKMRLRLLPLALKMGFIEPIDPADWVKVALVVPRLSRAQQRYYAYGTAVAPDRHSRSAGSSKRSRWKKCRGGRQGTTAARRMP